MAKIVQYPDKEGNRAYALTHWEAIVGKPELFTKEEVKSLVMDSVVDAMVDVMEWVQRQPVTMRSPDGSEWVASISNEGVVSWTRKEVDVDAGNEN